MVSDVTKRGDAALVEKTFGTADFESLPAALGSALADLARVAKSMAPDDISFSFDAPAGVLKFRAYRRARPDDDEA